MLATQSQDVKIKSYEKRNGIIDLSNYIHLDTVDVEKLLEWLKYQIKTFQILERVNVNRESSASTSFNTLNQIIC